MPMSSFQSLVSQVLDLFKMDDLECFWHSWYTTESQTSYSYTAFDVEVSVITHFFWKRERKWERMTYRKWKLNDYLLPSSVSLEQTPGVSFLLCFLCFFLGFTTLWRLLWIFWPVRLQQVCLKGELLIFLIVLCCNVHNMKLLPVHPEYLLKLNY